MKKQLYLEEGMFHNIFCLVILFRAAKENLRKKNAIKYIFQDFTNFQTPKSVRIKIIPYFNENSFISINILYIMLYCDGFTVCYSDILHKESKVFS